MSELNPNHPVTLLAHNEWHKLCGCLLAKWGLPSVEITEADVMAMAQEIGEGGAIALDCRGGRMVIRLLRKAEAEQLAKQEGGLPC